MGENITVVKSAKRTKSACSKTMLSMDRVFDALYELREQYNDGLLHRGEAVLTMMGKLEELAERDLIEAKHTAEAYGHDANGFCKFMKAREGK